MRAEIQVTGLADLRAALTRAEKIEARNELRDGLKRAADVVAKDAQGRVPSRTGRARSAIRAQASGNRALVVEGKAAVPYVAWLDFGSRTPRLGNPRSVGPWAGSGTGPPKGRFVYPAIDAQERRIVELVAEAVENALDEF